VTLADSFETGRPMACGACAAAPLAEEQAARARADIVLQIPGAHCATCIDTVEAALAGTPGVISARVNLTQRRVAVQTTPGVTVEGLVGAINRAGYEAFELDPAMLDASATAREGRDLLMRLAVSFFAMMNVMLLSVAIWSGADEATRDMFHWISAAIAMPVVLYAGQPFFRSAVASLRAGKLGMDVPISLALILACAMSLYETVQGGAHAYFDAAVMLCFFLLGGRYLDHRTRALARSAAAELAALEVPRAIAIRDGVQVVVPIAEVVAGDLLRVLPGARVPADGVVEDGASEIDRSLLTGETDPVAVAPGTAVSAGEMNLTGPLVLRVTAAGRDSSLNRMAELVAAAERAKGAMLSLSDRAAALYAPVVHVLAALAFAFWLWRTGGDLRVAANIASAVLIITCPCALGLAVPAVVTAASGFLFRKGMLIKDGTALERLAEVDTVVLDKTGTLTLGRPQVQGLDGFSREVVAVAAALAGATAHPLGQALAAAAREAGIAPAPVADLREVPGSGVEGLWRGARVRLGRADWVGAAAVDGTATYLAVGGATHAFTATDRLRPGAAEMVASLQARGLRLMILSGDVEGPVARLAGTLGIAEWQAGLRPADKAAVVARLAAEGRRVLMVGDGLNDTAALASAHVSISPASALDAARVASDIVLLGSDLWPIARALRLARKARLRIVQNFAISFGYNIIAVPLALMGLATPLAAAAAMSLSSITVSLNALRVK
jgi:Cu2+-exporting ATPase